MNDLLEGMNPVLEALRAGDRVSRIYLSRTAGNPRVRQLVELARTRGVPVEEVDRARLRSMSASRNPQGVVAEVRPYGYFALHDILQEACDSGQPPFLLVLDGVEDPQNLGAIIRTAECAGAHGVVIPRHGAARLSPAVARAAAGALEYVKVAQETNLARALDSLKEAGVYVVGTEAAASFLYTEVDLRGAVAVVVGGEERGIRRLVRERCDQLVRIPLAGRIGSLNAGVACGIVAYEVVRQRSFQGAVP
ncbi:MAG: 23S rRNA (guanosine(2251)-2'-O)-methyltransferase RlmB [Syntrophomonadaceae bacterium]|nr:23S rRNA (guanosine(2251)-2'-O)-methyltransferase RlmB [Syntrophomonadaceae bacterium]